MTKDELHKELDRIIPPTTKHRSVTRAIGHAMIELNLLTKIECAYEDCMLPSRTFPIWTKDTPPQDRAQPIIDHIVELWQGGNDMPDNFQLIHFACNCRKTARLRMADPEHRERSRQQSKERWQNPEYRERVLENVKTALNTDDVRARRSESMKRHWADPERRRNHIAGLARGERHRAARPDTPCDVCGKIFKGTTGVATHKGRKH